MKKRLLCIMLAGFMVFANACGNGAAETNGTANSENTGTESPAGGEEMTGAVAESISSADNGQATESTQAAESAQATATQSAGGNNQNTQVYVDRPPVDNGQSSQPEATYHYNHPEAANMTLSEICEKEAPYIGDDGMWHTPEDAELWVEDENTRYQEAVDKGWDIPW